MTEPLDPDTLAEIEGVIWGLPYPHPSLLALLAVARDHARLTAENERLRRGDWTHVTEVVPSTDDDEAPFAYPGPPPPFNPDGTFTVAASEEAPPDA